MKVSNVGKRLRGQYAQGQVTIQKFQVDWSDPGKAAVVRAHAAKPFSGWSYHNPEFTVTAPKEEKEAFFRQVRRTLMLWRKLAKGITLTHESQPVLRELCLFGMVIYEGRIVPKEEWSQARKQCTKSS